MEIDRSTICIYLQMKTATLYVFIDKNESDQPDAGDLAVNSGDEPVTNVVDGDKTLCFTVEQFQLLE